VDADHHGDRFAMTAMRATSYDETQAQHTCPNHLHNTAQPSPAATNKSKYNDDSKKTHCSSANPITTVVLMHACAQANPNQNALKRCMTQHENGGMHDPAELHPMRTLLA
jgi:hypothetical protein